MKLIQFRDSSFTRASPSGAEIEDDNFAFEFLKRTGTIVPDLDEFDRGRLTAFLLRGESATSECERRHDQT